MANNKNKNKNKRANVKKGLIGRKTEIEKLIVQSKHDLYTDIWLSPDKAKVRLPAARPSSSKSTSMRLPKGLILRHVSHHRSPQKVLPGLPEDRTYKILDIRHQVPQMPLVRIPCEPEIPRALRQYKPKGQFPFLELPGELRNKIYDYSIKDNHYAIEWIGNCEKSKSLTYWLRTISRTAGPCLKLDVAAAQRRHLVNDYRRGKTPERLPKDYFGATHVALLLACKQMHEEASSVFYSKCAFDFHGLHALDHFLNNLQPTAKTSITKLFITYRAHGNAEKTEEQCWKVKHDRRWEKLCWRMADECTSLTHLSLDLTLNKSPVSFCAFDDVEIAGIGALWVRPLRAFQDVGIKRCWLRVHCPVKERSVLEVESWKLRKEILGDLWDEKAEKERDAFGRDKPRKAAKNVKRGGTMRISADGGVEVA